MSTVKISELVEATAGNIANSSDVIIINDGNDTKKITVNNFLVAAGATVSGSLIPVTHGGATTSSFDLGSPTAAWRELYVSTASINFVDAAGTITKFTKADITNLKAGKSLRTGSKQIVHESDESTFVQMKSSTPGKVIHSVSNTTLLDMTTGSFTVGEGRVPLTVTGANINMNASQIAFTSSFSNRGSSSFTGSFDISGSTTVSGSFTVTDLLNVLADYNQTGSFSVSGSTTLAGDVNMDGAVNVQDLLTVLAGFNASGSSTNTGSFNNSGSFSNEGTGSFTGSFENSGSFSNEGTGSFTGSFENSGSFENTGSFRVFTGNQAVEFDAGTGGFAVNNLLNLLANFSQSGVEGGVTEGDINLDGQVNVNDLLLGLSGFGNPNTIANNILIPPNVNHQYIGPTITILSPVSMSISTGSFVSITL